MQDRLTVNLWSRTFAAQNVSQWFVTESWTTITKFLDTNQMQSAEPQDSLFVCTDCVKCSTTSLTGGHTLMGAKQNRLCLSYLHKSDNLYWSPHC